jgi:outer membrane receptor for ferrienterochelin and colicin
MGGAGADSLGGDPDHGGLESADPLVPTGVTIVGWEEIERRTPQVLPNLLRGKEGVFVQQTTAGQAAPIIQGLKGSEVLHLVGGIRLNNVFFRNAPNQYIALADACNVSAWR